MATPITVKVAFVKNVRPHPGADKLELLDILGWQMVVPIGMFQDSAKVVYFPPDTILPDKWIERFGVRNYLRGKEQNRVGKIRLRGEASFGLAVPLPEGQDWEVGANVAEFFGATKYEPPICAKCEDAEVEHPLFPCYTDIENLRNHPDVFDSGEFVVATEKCHGTNSRTGIIQGEEMAGSMTTRRKRPSEEDMHRSLYWSPFRVPGVRKLLHGVSKDRNADQVILYGEIYGRSVQSLSYGIEKGKGFGFVAYDLLVQGEWLNWSDFQDVCNQYAVPIVPVLYHGAFDMELVKRASDGPSPLANGLHIREGIVVKPIHERRSPALGRVIFKYLGDSYLLGKHSDFKDV